MAGIDIPKASIPQGIEREKGVKDGWNNETVERRSGVAAFLRNYLSTPLDSRPHYNGVSDLHFSGTNSKVIDKIWNGTANISEVTVLYEDQRPIQIHVIFDGENAGHNIDVYFQEKALRDLLASSDNQDVVRE